MNKVNKITQKVKSTLHFFRNLLIVHWRSLLLMFLGVYLPLQVVQILAVKVWQNEGGFPWDVPTLLAIHAYSNPRLDIFAVFVTRVGSAWTAFPVLSAIAFLLWQRKRWRSLAYVVITALGNVAINRTAKEIMHRIRPQLWESKAPEFDYSFPSGHAMTSMTLVAILLVLNWHHPRRWLILAMGSLYLLLIGWTRLYLGVHFPSDILAGWMVALAWSIGVSLIIKPNLHRVPPSNSKIQPETSLLPDERE
jgi:membrane-associated phospholipid phosphatase